MTFSALPIDQRPYRRFAALTPSDSTVYDPPPDAIWILGSSNRGTVNIVGADDAAVVVSLGTGPTEILPFSIKKLMATNTSGLGSNPIGLWRD